MIQMMVVVDKPVAVVLQADIIFHGEGYGGPWMRFKLGAVDKKIGFGQHFRDEDVIAQPSFMV